MSVNKKRKFRDVHISANTKKQIDQMVYELYGLTDSPHPAVAKVICILNRILGGHRGIFLLKFHP